MKWTAAAALAVAALLPRATIADDASPAPLPAPAALASPATTPSADAVAPIPDGPLSAADLKTVYEKIRDAVNATALPPYVAFTLENASHQSGDVHRERLQIVVRESDDVAVVRTLRASDGSVGSLTPEVVSTPTFPMTLIYRLGDFPLADFGLRVVATRPGIFDATGTPEPFASGDPLKTLATVSVVDLPYRLRDLGPETIEGRTTRHVGLEPLRDPGHHVLREMWLDPGTYLPVRYVAERFVEDVVPFHYYVTVETAIVGGHLVNASATGHYEIHRSPTDQLSGESRWSITDIGFPENEPAWAFDPAEIANHREEMIPGL